MSQRQMAPSTEDINRSVEHVFDQFVTAVTCKSVISSFNQLVDLTGLRHADHSHFYNALKGKLAGSWKGQALWSKLDKRAAHRDYKRGQAAKNMRVLIIGAGPCGLRTAIECAFLGAKTVLVEKRDRFSRNNVLHLWPYLITDLRNLGAKKFFGKFCAGSIDHISIRQLQCILLKVALLLGVEVHVNVAFEGLVEPPEDQSTGVGWRCKVDPSTHAVSEFVFDVLIGADGKRNTLPGFKRKEFRGKLAIAITANFINRNTQQEARVEEISGVAFIFNQKFFLDLKELTRIDLENIVYYKDDTHYFVMTAKKASLLEKGVLKEDYGDTIALLDRSNVNQERLLSYAKEAAEFSTNYQLPNLEYAVNHYGQADVAMFDFTSMFAAENASRFVLKNGHHLLMGLVGDSLLEPFWPTGSGCARGFLGAFDAAWAIRSWASGNVSPLQVLAERESIYTVLSQTTPNYLHKNYNQYSLDPNTRYMNLHSKCVKPAQVRQFYEGGEFLDNADEEDGDVTVPTKRPRNSEENIIDSYSLLRWCQRVLNTGKFRDVHVVDFTSSWRSGLALCALIHSFRPELVNMNGLLESDVAANNQLAFNIAEQELGIPPVMCGADMAKQDGPDKLTMVAYLSQFYQLFRQDVLPSTVDLPVVMRNKRKSTSKDGSVKSPRSPSRRISFLQRLSSRLAKSKKRKEQELNEASPLSSKKMKEKEETLRAETITGYSKLPMEEIANRLQVQQALGSKPARPGEDMTGAMSVTAMAEVLRAKFKSLQDQPAPEPVRRMKGQQPILAAASSASEYCSFCHKRVYIMERMSAEGEFFHRHCFKCDHCYVGLRLNNYSCDKDTKPVKFYCYRHALPEMRLRPQRKRGLEEETKENVPETVIHPPPEDFTTQASKQKSPKKNAPSNLSPVLLPTDVLDKPSKTPERVEFEISFDGQEESEEEQFEHNLRASMSSDTLLDDEDSDSDSSDLEDDGSGAEDEVWESASEVPGSPLTLQEVNELVVSLGQRHLSREDTLGNRSYQRLEEGQEDDDEDEEEEDEDDDEDDEEDEESTTEVEGESEYETESSEEDSIVKNAPRIIRQTKESHGDEGRQIKTSAVIPTSPSTRLSASKASFFSEPPKVVSLDPWSMFGIGNKKGSGKEVGDKSKKEKKVEGVVMTTDEESVSVSDSTRKISHESHTEDVWGKDGTDVSESLDQDVKEKEEERRRKVSEVGSIEELDDELEIDEKEEEEKIENGEIRKRGILVKSESFDIDDNRDEERGGEEGDDEEEEAEEEGNGEAVKKNHDDNDDDELLEKTAVSHAMEQLLKDIDHKGEKGLASEDFRIVDTSSSGENEPFIEGRLSPSANKTRKFRMRRQAVRHAKAKRQQRSMSLTSESEAGRTDPTTTDNSLPQSSSVSRSPSVEWEKLNSLSTRKSTSSGEKERGDKDSSESPDKETNEHDAEALPCDDRTPVVEIKVLGENLNELKTVKEKEVRKMSIPEVTLEDINTMGVSTTGGDDTLRQVLESIAAMPDLSQDSDVDDMVFNDIDDRFVTSRKKRRSKKTGIKLRKIGSTKTEKAEGDEDSSFSISTPSDSESSVSSVEGINGLTKSTEDNDDEKPDEEMLKEYHTTMSLALEESFSDGEADLKDVVRTEGVERKDEANGVEEKEGKEENTNVEDQEEEVESSVNSVYGTPEISMENREPLSKIAESATLHSVQTPNTTSLDSPTPAIYSTSLTGTLVHPRESARDSSGSDMFFSPVESFSSPPILINTNNPIDTSLAAASTAASPTPSTPQLPKEIIPSSKDLDSAKNSPPISSKHSSTHSLCSSNSSQTSSAATTKESLLKTETISSNLSNSRPHRKLPELPKLKVPSKQTTRGGNIKPEMMEPPASCSSPKLTTKLRPLHTSDNNKLDSPKVGRPLPLPKLSSSTSSTNKTSSTLTSSSSLSATPTSSVKSTLSSSTVSSTSISFVKPSSTAAVSPVSTPSSTKPTSSSFGAKGNALYNKPISPPVFRPPVKTVVPIDKNKIQLGSSAEGADSDQEVGKKKRISAEGISLENNGIDDIPFADESSEMEEKFYTPHSTMKQQKPSFPASHHDASNMNARKRILPNTPLGNADPVVLSAQQIREIRKADMEKAKVQARERARLKSDEELGISVGNALAETPVKAVSRVKGKLNQDDRRSASFDTPSASDNNILSDSDDKLSSVTSPASSAGEQNLNSGEKGNNKNKSKIMKGRKAKKVKKKEMADSAEKKEKKKSLLALILPGKSSPDKSSNNKENHKSQEPFTSTDSATPKDSGDDGHSKTRLKVKSPKSSNKKSNKRHNNLSKSHSRESLDDRTPVAESKKDLAICSVFHSGATGKTNQMLHDLTRRTLPSMAPKASIDDFSDSDESHISQFTVRKMEDNLDERVSRRLRKIQQKQQRQAQQKRLRMAQEIQRQLEEVEVRQRELEERGTTVEKILRGDGPDDVDFDEGKLMNEWFSLVHEKNALLRYESELNVRAKELELEDRQARLESDFRERSRKAGLHPKPLPDLLTSKGMKTDVDIRVESQLLDELLDVVEQRNTLVAMLEEDRLREKKEDAELQDMMLHKGYVLSPLSYDTRRDRQNVSAPLASPVL